MKQWKGEACTENIPVTADFLSEALEAGGCPPGDRGKIWYCPG